MTNLDTIAAFSTPPGNGSIGIIRISGNLTKKVAYLILKKIPSNRLAEYLSFFDLHGKLIDKGIAIFYSKPNSYTGEDVLELQGHGGQIVLDMLLKCVISIKGIRIANPGEFSERAFINEKIDLIQAEAIYDIINANSITAVKCAINSIKGDFSLYINNIIKTINNLRIKIEASIDFSDQNIDIVDLNEIENNINYIISLINKLKNESKNGIILREGINTVIVGESNVGKSSLFNLLSKKEISIVTEIKGTTRDIIHEYIKIDELVINLIDTAGIRFTKNKIEKIGISRTWNEIKSANHILLLFDSNKNIDISKNIIFKKIKEFIKCNSEITIIFNKSDINKKKICIKNVIINNENYTTIHLSTKYDIESGINILKNHLKNIMLNNTNDEGIFISRRRHLYLLEKSYICLLNCKNHIKNNNSYELIAEELMLCHKYLNHILGKFKSNNLIKDIFSKFCIGK
ncbi:MAG: tRNA uridine-5-carboxymethylaminomethyl(34) synthesis GTPase MnmE [Candidatus Makana argininalis]